MHGNQPENMGRYEVVCEIKSGGVWQGSHPLKEGGRKVRLAVFEVGFALSTRIKVKPF